MKQRAAPVAALVVLTSLFSGAASVGQEAIFTRSATQPAAGVLGLRQLFRYQSYAGDIDEFGARTILSYGLTGNAALEVQLPYFYTDMPGAEPVAVESPLTGTPAPAAPPYGHAHGRNGVPAPASPNASKSPSRHQISGLGDILILGKTRLWQRHDSAVDTLRLGAFAGAAISAGPDDFTGAGFDPTFGLVGMQVAGRVGWNFAAQYYLTTSGSDMPLHPGASNADLMTFDFAYLWRLAPEEYSAENMNAWYFTMEANSAYETNGDRELLLAPGLLFEGTDLALEIGVQLPVARTVRYRPARDFGIALGFRLLF
ncbi:MAG TPA: transporter [Planctomycetia bacterium]|nr:transporter [Planctomycetia bacterium]